MPIYLIRKENINNTCNVQVTAAKFHKGGSIISDKN